MKILHDSHAPYMLYHMQARFCTPLRCPQGGAKIAQGGAKKNRARFAREISHPPEQIPENAPVQSQYQKLKLLKKESSK